MDSDIQRRLEDYRKEVFKLELQLESKKQQANDFLDLVYKVERIDEQEYQNHKERFALQD